MKSEIKTQVFLGIVAAVVLAGWLTYNAIFYQDWRCAFVRCVRVENIK